jgi:glycosyltransferase involved in cell wall biosynthesis
MDGGSSDGTIDLIKKYEPWITYWVSEKDRGQSHAINKGLTKCTGEICNWINSDDCLTPASLHRIQKELSGTGALVFCGNALVTYDTPGKESELFRTSLLDKDINTHLASCSFCQPGTFFHMDAFRQITPLEENLHMNMDMYMWYRFVCMYGMEKIAFTDEIICTVKAHKDAKTVKSFEKSFVEKQRIFDSLFVAISPSYKPQTAVLPLPLSPAVRERINSRQLKKNYYRMHLWETNMEGKISNVKIGHLLKWLFAS